MAFNLHLDTKLPDQGEEIHKYQNLNYLANLSEKILLSPHVPQAGHTISEWKFSERIKMKVQEHLGSDFDWHNVMITSSYVLGILEGKPDEELREIELIIYAKRNQEGIKEIQTRLQEIFRKFMDKYQGKLFGMLLNREDDVYLDICIPGKYPIQINGVLVDSFDEKNILEEHMETAYLELGYDGKKIHYTDQFIKTVQSRLVGCDEWTYGYIAGLYLAGYHVSFREADISKIYQKIQKLEKRDPYLHPLPLALPDESDYDYQNRARAFILIDNYYYWYVPTVVNKYGKTEFRKFDHLIIAEEWKNLMSNEFINWMITYVIMLCSILSYYMVAMSS